MFNFDPNRLLEIIIRIPVVLFSLSLHEVAHGYAAYKLGDPTARNLGRLSLNPLKHLDPIGAVCMLLFRFGWAKPVPINTRYFKNPRRDMAISALAGPVSNLILAFLSFIVYQYINVFNRTHHFFYWIANINGDIVGDVIFSSDTGKIVYIFSLIIETMLVLNISLAIFNLIPIPPLDGSRILFIFLPVKLYFGIMKYEQFISLGILAALYMGLLDAPLNFVFNLFIHFFEFITQFLPYL